jgi:hypothetical protein
LHLQTKIDWTSVGRKKQWGVSALMRGPPRSPDLTLCDFFLWGFIKDRVFGTTTSATLVDLRTRITLIHHDMLQRVCQELDYRLDVCRVTGGAHVEHL